MFVSTNRRCCFKKPFATFLLLFIYFTKCFIEWVITATPNGWTDDAVALEWLEKVFEPRTGSGTRRLLLLDGHDSYTTWRFVLFCRRRHILLVCLPAHTSHLLQPLDRGMFSPLEHRYTQQVSRASGLGLQRISRELFLKRLDVYAAEYPRWWRAAGIEPHRPVRVLTESC